MEYPVARQLSSAFSGRRFDSSHQAIAGPYLTREVSILGVGLANGVLIVAGIQPFGFRDAASPVEPV
jgi:hypothetical protein